MSKRRFLISLVALVAVQVGLWIAVGADGPLKTVPRMIEKDIDEARRHYEKKGEPPPESSGTETLVLCPELDSALSLKRVVELQDSLAALGKTVIHEADAPTDWMKDGLTKPGFTKLCAEVSWQTPIVAQVEVVYWNGPLGAGGAGHRAWFVFGFWVSSSANSAWVS